MAVHAPRVRERNGSSPSSGGSAAPGAAAGNAAIGTAAGSGSGNGSGVIASGASATSIGGIASSSGGIASIIGATAMGAAGIRAAGVCRQQVYRSTGNVAYVSLQREEESMLQVSYEAAYEAPPWDTAASHSCHTLASMTARNRGGAHRGIRVDAAVGLLEK